MHRITPALRVFHRSYISMSTTHVRPATPVSELVYLHVAVKAHHGLCISLLVEIDNNAARNLTILQLIYALLPSG